MDAKEANRIISEYVAGYKTYANVDEAMKDDLTFFTLDSLVPVWEKLDLPNILEMDIRQHTKPNFSFRIYTDLAYTQSASGSTIQEAATIATAKAIQELTKGE